MAAVAEATGCVRQRLCHCRYEFRAISLSHNLALVAVVDVASSLMAISLSLPPPLSSAGFVLAVAPSKKSIASKCCLRYAVRFGAAH